MTIPKKKRRILTHKDVRYEWCITGNVTFYVKNLDTGKEHTETREGSKTVMQHGPIDIKDIIVKNNL